MPGVTPSAASQKSPLQRAFPAILVAYTVVILLCGLIIDGTRGRTFLHLEVQRHFYLGFLAAIACACVITYSALLVRVLPTAPSWKVRLLFSVVYLFLTLRWVLFVAVLPMTIMEAMFYHLPRTPFVFQTVVMQSESYRSHGARVQAVTFALPAGERIRLTQSSWKPLRLFTQPIPVNGQCTLDALQPGQHITVYARSSRYGYAMDRITSAVPCSQLVGQ